VSAVVGSSSTNGNNANVRCSQKDAFSFIFYNAPLPIWVLCPPASWLTYESALESAPTKITVGRPRNELLYSIAPAVPVRACPVRGLNLPKGIPLLQPMSHVG
jgi:hypothetical protein